MNVLQKILLSSLLAALVAPATLLADDIEPPPWRGEPNSVTAKFDLQGIASLDSINFGANPTYPLSMVQPDITQDPTGAPFYQVTLPNYIDDLPLKRMRIQYSWFGSSANPGDAILQTVMAVPQTNNIFLVDSIPPTPVPGTPNTFYRWDDIYILPNPDFETIQFEFVNADPKWVVVDTISTIPEPTSLALAGLAGLAILAWRRR